MNEIYINIYKTDHGKEPCVEWENALDINIRAKIAARITRIRSTGNFEDCEFMLYQNPYS